MATLAPRLSAEQRHNARIRAGVLIASYEAIALAIDRPDRVPGITALCHRQPILAASCAVWTAAHLLRPWLPVALRRSAHAA